MSKANNFFQFEADFVDSLRCIPMQVRLKLDTCGIKLKLPQWNRFSTEARASLVSLSCETDEEIKAYRDVLKQLVFQTTGEAASELSIDPEPAWNNTIAIAASVQAKAQELGIELTLPQWAALTTKQRFALIKLSRSTHENHNFLPALKEFNVI
jgi:hypothetical protein